MKKLLILLIITLSGWLTTTAQNHGDSLYFVHLRDGSALYSHKVELKSSLSQDKYLLLDYSRQIPLSQVKDFKGWEGSFAVGNIDGHFDAYKLQNEGRRISLYAQCYESTSIIYSSPTPDGVATPTTITSHEKAYFFRKEPDGDIQRANYHNLITAMADNPSSVHELRIAHTGLYLGIGLLVGGAALAAAGIIHTAQRNNDASNAFKTASANWYIAAQRNPNTPLPPLPPHYGLSPLFYIGTVASLSAIVPVCTAGKHAKRALLIYNGIE